MKVSEFIQLFEGSLNCLSKNRVSLFNREVSYVSDGTTRQQKRSRAIDAGDRLTIKLRDKCSVPLRLPIGHPLCQLYLKIKASVFENFGTAHWENIGNSNLLPDEMLGLQSELFQYWARPYGAKRYPSAVVSVEDEKNYYGKLARLLFPSFSEDWKLYLKNYWRENHGTENCYFSVDAETPKQRLNERMAGFLLANEALHDAGQVRLRSKQGIYFYLTPGVKTENNILLGSLKEASFRALIAAEDGKDLFFIADIVSCMKQGFALCNPAKSEQLLTTAELKSLLAKVVPAHRELIRKAMAQRAFAKGVLPAEVFEKIKDFIKAVKQPEAVRGADETEESLSLRSGNAYLKATLIPYVQSLDADWTRPTLFGISIPQAGAATFGSLYQGIVSGRDLCITTLASQLASMLASIDQAVEVSKLLEVYPVPQATTSAATAVAEIEDDLSDTEENDESDDEDEDADADADSTATAATVRVSP
jgi:hypothetical protein